MENVGAVDDFVDSFEVIGSYLGSAWSLEDSTREKNEKWLTSITVPIQGVLGALGILEVMFWRHFC